MATDTAKETAHRCGLHCHHPSEYRTGRLAEWLGDRIGALSASMNPARDWWRFHRYEARKCFRAGYRRKLAERLHVVR
jgi:hypothetical protein